MRKNLFYVFIAFVYIWSWSIFNVANANETKVSKEYIETVVGHVIRNIDDFSKNKNSPKNHRK